MCRASRALQWNATWKSIRKLDLRFPDDEKEVHFVRYCEQKLLYMSLMAYILAAVGWVATSDELSFTSTRSDPRVFRSWFNICTMLLVSFIMMLMTAFRLAWGCFAFANWEILSAFHCTIINVTTPWINGWTAAQLYGLDPDDVWSRDMRASEGNVALSIATINAAVCLFLPIRIWLKWIPPLCGVLSFSLSTIIVGSPFPDHIRSNIFLLFVLAFCALWGAWNNEQVARQNFVAQRLVRSSSQSLDLQLEANSTMLGRLCDAFIQLNHELEIVVPDPRFSTLLLCSRKEGIQGSKFCDYLASDQDRHTFKEALKEENNGGMIHTSLCDMHGRRFAVYVHHAIIFDADGKCGHMLALVEAQERESIETTDPAPALGQIWDNHRYLDDEDDRVSMFSGSTVTLPSMQGASGEAAILVDVATQNIPIIKASVGFSVFGPVRDANLASILSSDFVRFQGWLQESVNQSTYSNKVRSLQVRLRTTPQSRFEFVARCTLDAQHSEGADQGEEDTHFHLVFSDISCRRRRSSRPQALKGSFRRNSLKNSGSNISL